MQSLLLLNGPPDAVIQDFPRSNLVDFLTTYWQALKVDGLYTDSSVQTFQRTWEDGPAHVHRLHHHLILRQLNIEDDLHQWRRSIAEIRNLEGYLAFLAEVSRQRTTRKQVRQRGEKDTDRARKDYTGSILSTFTLYGSTAARTTTCLARDSWPRTVRQLASGRTVSSKELSSLITMDLRLTAP
jgi:hypothetical protein